jgi:hypothetical protein
MNDADGKDTFDCPQCRIMYRAAYKIFTTIQQGKFDCVECKAEVHAWHGVRDYFQWERI